MTIKEQIEKALTLGFSKAVFLENLSLECDPNIRQYCNKAQCSNYRSNWVCPPGCGDIHKCNQKLKGFTSGILLQSVSELKLPIKDDTYKELNKKHNLLLKKFIESSGLKEKKLILTTGGCIFCPKCVYPFPCVKPDIKMDSLSAFGIDVGKLCEKVGLEYSFRQDKIYFTALVLFN